jgi:hypothetical protein
MLFEVGLSNKVWYNVGRVGNLLLLEAEKDKLEEERG